MDEMTDLETTIAKDETIVTVAGGPGGPTIKKIIEVGDLATAVLQKPTKQA